MPHAGYTGLSDIATHPARGALEYAVSHRLVDGYADGKFRPYQLLKRRELAYEGLSELIVTHSMHERKQRMADLSDGFMALPGGFGTFEEFCEIVTWAQLGLHEKPCGLLNLAGYYDRLLAMFDHALDQGFLRPAHRSLVLADADPGGLLAKMQAWEPPALERWLAPDAA